MTDLKSPILWELGAENRPFRVECSDEDIMNKNHYVFTIPRSAMKTRASNFLQFRTNPRAQALKRAFHFFLDFAQAMIEAKEKKSPLHAGQNVLCFSEWCPADQSKVELNTAGWRIHVFVDRGMKEMDVLRSFVEKRSAEVAKLKSQNKHVPPHYNIRSLMQYNTKVYGAYTGLRGNVSHLYTADEGLTNSPSECFKMEEIDGSMYPLNSYTNEAGSFVFPSFCFIRIDPVYMSFENFAHRRLPDHVMFARAKPEVRIWRDEGLHVEFQPHRYYRDFGNAWDEQSLASWISENKDKYVIYEEDTTDACFDIGEITSSKKLHEDRDIVELLDLHNMHCKQATLYSAMLRHQAKISMIDYIKLDAMKVPDKNKYIMEEFLAHVYEDYDDCLISEPMKAIMRWFDNEYDFGLLQKQVYEMGAYKLRYEGMSVFGHRCLLGMEIFDNLYQICSAHHPLHFLLIARCDAGRHVHGLHLNAIFTGDAATSKSYLLNNVMAANSIGDTVSERTYDTAKADAVDDDKDHAVHVFDEAPATYFKDPKEKGGANEAQKRKLTECSTSHRRLHTHEDTGKREQITSVSSNIGCQFIATNESRTSFEDAFQTRFHFFESERLLKVEPGRGMQERISALETMDESTLLQKEAAEMWFKFEQGYVFMMWQFIHMGSIQKPDMTAHSIVSKRFQSLMLQNGINTETITRTMSRVKMLCQICAIIRAKQILYCTETGKYVNTPFHPSQLPDAEPYMIVTEEIVIHCIGMCFEGIMSRSRGRVLRALWKMHTDNPMYKPSDKYGEPDYNYIEVNSSKSVLQAKIKTCLEQMKEHVSGCNISTVLKELERNVMTNGYVAAQPGVPGTFNDRFPEYNTIKRSYAMCEQHPNKFYFHMELFAGVRQGEEKNIYKTIMRDLAHEYTDDKLIVLGTKDYRLPTRPEVFDTISLAPKNGRVIRFKRGIGRVRNTFGIVGNSQALPPIVLDTDVDVYAANQRSDKLQREVTPYEPNEGDWADDTEISYPPSLPAQEMEGPPPKRLRIQ